MQDFRYESDALRPPREEPGASYPSAKVLLTRHMIQKENHYPIVARKNEAKLNPDYRVHN